MIFKLELGRLQKTYFTIVKEHDVVLPKEEKKKEWDIFICNYAKFKVSRHNMFFF